MLPKEEMSVSDLQADDQICPGLVAALSLSTAHDVGISFPKRTIGLPLYLTRLLP